MRCTILEKEISFYFEEKQMSEEEKFSLPGGFATRMRSLLGESEYAELEASYDRDSEGSIKALRVNTLKLTPEKFRELSSKAFGISDLEPVPWESTGFYYPDSMRPGRHPYHAAGLYYIQEPSAMAAAALSGVKRGERVLDLCAAPGGKTTQLAAMMQGEGLLLANEINTQRAKILSENVERCGVRNAIVTNMDSGALRDRFTSWFDRILVDAPCSGEGMFRKEEAARTGWSMDNIRLCAARQDEILDNAAAMLSEGGTLVYSTCTFAPEEDEGTVCRFLERHPDFSVIALPAEHGFEHGRPEWAAVSGMGEDSSGRKENSGRSEETAGAVRLWPHRVRGEGHFIAMLRKDGENAVKTCTDRVRAADRSSLACWKEFAQEEITGFDAPEERIVKFGDELYLLPAMIDLTGLKVMRAGIDLGSIRKGRFEPAHALAFALKKENFRQSINLSLPSDLQDALNYLKGMTLPADPGVKGWTVLMTDGFPIGWTKAAGGVLKNHYPKGLRWLS